MKCLCNLWKSSSMIMSAEYPTTASNSASEAEEDGVERSSFGASSCCRSRLSAALARPPLSPPGRQLASGRPLCAGRPAHGPAGQRLHARPRPQAPGLRAGPGLTELVACAAHPCFLTRLQTEAPALLLTEQTHLTPSPLDRLCYWPKQERGDQQTFLSSA